LSRDAKFPRRNTGQAIKDNGISFDAAFAIIGLRRLIADNNLQPKAVSSGGWVHGVD
jgi:hypothetical protein